MLQTVQIPRVFSATNDIVRQKTFEIFHKSKTKILLSLSVQKATIYIYNNIMFSARRTWPALMAHSYRLGLVTWGNQVQIPVGTDICHLGCAYTVLQTVQRHGVHSAAYGTVHYKEPLKLFEIRVRHSPGFGLPSVAILP